MGEPTEPVPTGISDISLATEAADDSFPPLMPTGHVPNDPLDMALLPRNDEVLSPGYSLLAERVPTTPGSFSCVSPVGIPGQLAPNTGLPNPSTPASYNQLNQSLTQNLHVVDARQVVLNQDMSPMVQPTCSRGASQSDYRRTGSRTSGAAPAYVSRRFGGSHKVEK